MSGSELPGVARTGRSTSTSGQVPVVSLDDSSRVASPRVVPTVVVVGLGPAGPELTTLEAREVLSDMGVVLVRTSRHPAAAPLMEDGARPLDAHYERAGSFEEAYAGMVEEVVAAAVEHGRVAYCVPGSPFVLERSVAALIADERVAVKVVPGMSFLDLVWSRLLLDPVEVRVRLVNAEEFAVSAAGDSGPLLITQLWSRAICSDVKLAVEEPPKSPVVLLHHLGMADEVVQEIAWEDLDRIVAVDHLTCVYVRELGEPVGAELVRLAELVRTLRERCPWDRVQTHHSLVRHLVEETYEAIEAIEELGEEPTAEAAAHLEEELGDVLCQVMFHSTLAAEEGLFNLADVARAVHDKLVRRHPHVFGPPTASTERVDTAARVLEQWEQSKQVEKGRQSLMDGIPAGLPALAMATKLERKAAAVDLGWQRTGSPLATVRDALEALEQGETDGLGELLLAIARMAADRGADPEEALRRAARAMRERFMATERAAAEVGENLAELDSPVRLERWRSTDPS
jgi:tetrapyrrole methylase family protein/MazG family protein